MKPEVKNKIEYEKVKIGEFIYGIISDIQYDVEHEFRGFRDKPPRIAPACRFVFELVGYAFKHYSRWMKFNYGEKANLYKKYLSKLISDPSPDMDFDLDILKGMKVKTVWLEKNGFQDVEAIYADEGRIASKEYNTKG